jgi:23S rRNA pseudouridine1911/1915/1917 synthase
MPDERQRPRAEAIDLRILYEDEWIIAVDKPAGMVVHPTYRNASGTLLNGVLWRVRDRAGASPGILTRLDKDTSGLVILGLTSAIHAAMQKDGDAGRITKQYLAVVRGTPSPAAGRIVLPLGRDSVDRRIVVVRPDGQHAETRYEVLSTCRGGPSGPRAISLLRCEPITGRTHQIRVHLASQGWPIVGDRVYGEADAVVARQALHAWKVTLPHPVTRQRLDVESPPCDDLRPLLQNFTL